MNRFIFKLSVSSRDFVAAFCTVAVLPLIDFDLSVMVGSLRLVFVQQWGELASPNTTMCTFSLYTLPLYDVGRQANAAHLAP